MNTAHKIKIAIISSLFLQASVSASVAAPAAGPGPRQAGGAAARPRGGDGKGKEPMAPGKESMIKNVIVARQSSEYLGNMILYLSDRAGRFVARNEDIVIATHAPDWQIIVYSHKKNKAWVYSPSSGKEEKLEIFTTFFSMPSAKHEDGHDDSLKVDYTKVYAVAGPKMDGSNDAFIFRNRTRRLLRDQIVRIAKVGELPPEMRKFVNFVYNTSGYTGVPLDNVTTYKDGTTNTKYHTYSVGRENKPASFFAYPSGYVKVADKLQVLLADDTQTTLEDLFAPEPDKHK